MDSIEHGDGFTEALLDQAVKQGAYWCPTVMVGAYVAPGRGGNWQPMVDLEKKAFGLGVKKGVKIRGRCSSGIPQPLSLISTSISPDFSSVVIVMQPSPRQVVSIACMALTSKFKKT